jgi:integrase
MLPTAGCEGGRMRVRLVGVHRVRKRLASGQVVEYHYAFRGGPQIWRTGEAYGPGSLAYLAKLRDAEVPKAADGMFRQIIMDYQGSGEWRKLAPRTKADYRRWIDEIDAEFGDAPKEAFNRPTILAEALKWRDRWDGRQADYAWTVLVRIVSWAHKRKILHAHQLLGVERLYSADRSEIIWTDPDLVAFAKVAPQEVVDALIGATETGLRPGDLVRLSRAHVQSTPRGRRIKIRTSKRGKVAAIPVTQRMAEIIDAVPKGQMLIFLSSHGEPWDEKQLSKQVTKYRRKAGLDDRLRLYDARGTACTRLLMAGATLAEIALHMGWSVKTAAEMIEVYASLDPALSDSVLVRLEEARRPKHERAL